MALHGGTKRAYQSDRLPPIQPSQGSPIPASPPSSIPSASSAFRNVSACNRCRTRKNKCDQRLPACAACEKAKVKCTGYDPITKREIPRSYVYHLESRQQYLEDLLTSNGIPFDPPGEFDGGLKTYRGSPHSPEQHEGSGDHQSVQETPSDGGHTSGGKRERETENINNLVSNIGMVSVAGASDSRFLGSTSGISFARLVLAAVKNSVSSSNSERSGIRPSRTGSAAIGTGGRTMRDSYFGLQTKPIMKKAPLPDRALGERLVKLYFGHANAQIPILHRVDFVDMFTRVYDDMKPTSKDLYLLNIVFAIGAGTIFGSSDPSPDMKQRSDHPQKKARLAGVQHQPEEYHASAIEHLGSVLGAGSSSDKSESTNGTLEELQAVLLLASFALLRPVAPGLWYITGVAVRLAVDLGLHFEDNSNGHRREPKHQSDPNTDIEMKDSDGLAAPQKKPQAYGRHDWNRDMRRRLWWCVYNFDRLVSTCVGRPFGITDLVITTEFPSLLDDAYITRDGFLPPSPPGAPSYKLASHHYFKLRLLQSEIVQVLQYQQAQLAGSNGAASRNEYLRRKLVSPFLSDFGNDFRAWRRDVDRRLWEWKESAPKQSQTGVNFRVEFLELNYWQAVTTLYRQSLGTPSSLEGEKSPTAGVASPMSTRTEEPEDEDEVFLKCAEAGQQTLKIYRQLHRIRLVNYTYLATHHLFMAGISFLFAIWHSNAVRSNLTLDEVDFTILAATSVLEDLMEKCPPAEACRDVFQRMAKATVQMFANSFGSERNAPNSSTSQYRQSFQNNYSQPTVPFEEEYKSPSNIKIAPKPLSRNWRPPPRFDPDLRDLFADDLDPSSLTSQTIQKAPLRPFRATPADSILGQQDHSQVTRPTNQTPSYQAPSPADSILPPDLSTMQLSTNTFSPAQANANLGFTPSSSLATTSQVSAPDYFSYTDPSLFPLQDTSDGLSFNPSFGVAGFDFTHDWAGAAFDGSPTEFDSTTGAASAPAGNVFGVDFMDGFWFGGPQEAGGYDDLEHSGGGGA